MEPPGFPVLFVHGFPFNHTMWDEQLEGLPADWRLLAPDLRGFGRTSGNGEGGSYTMERFAADLVSLLDERQIRRAVVCGLSMGGYIAFALWREHAERVRALVLCNTRAGADTEEVRRGRRELAERIGREGAAAATAALLPKLVSARTRRERPEVVARVRTMIEATSPTTMARALQAMAMRPDATPLLPTINVPTLVIAGADDAIIPVSEAELLARSILGARLAVLPEVGHVSSLEDPPAFNRELLRFLRAL